MPKPWSKAEAQVLVEEQAAAWGDALCELTYMTRLAGSQPELVMHGGGNTSLKGTLTNVFGEDVRALFVKPSGVDMATVAPDAFVALDLATLARLLGVVDLDEDTMADEFACRRLRPHPGRPSIETLLHVAIPAPYVLHTHPSAILALTNSSDGEGALAAALGGGVGAVPYARAGIELAHAVQEALTRRPEANALSLLHHGLVTWGATAEEAYATTVDLVSRAKAYLDDHRRRSLPAASEETSEASARRYRALAPVLRGVLGPTAPDSIGDRVILDVLRDPETLGLLEAEEGRSIAVTPPLTPDHLIWTRRLPLWLEASPLENADALREQWRRALEAYRAEYRRYVEAHASRIPVEPAPRSLLPRVVMVRGLGVVCVGSDAADARRVRDITRQALAVKRAIYSTAADIVPLGDEHLFDMEFGRYQRAKLDGTPSRTLGGTVALVTGAAGAIGSGICEALAQAGCHVAATDLGGPGLESLAGELEQRFGPRVLGVPMDVTDPESVATGFSEVVATWGGIDAVVANAGVAHVARLSELSLDAFRRLEHVNVEGTLLGRRASAGPHRQPGDGAARREGEHGGARCRLLARIPAIGTLGRGGAQPHEGPGAGRGGSRGVLPFTKPAEIPRHRAARGPRRALLPHPSNAHDGRHVAGGRRPSRRHAAVNDSLPGELSDARAFDADREPRPGTPARSIEGQESSFSRAWRTVSLSSGSGSCPHSARYPSSSRRPRAPMV
jgi:rhamnose utilization protein RhaD (predicted bifunctional aldolase and dehydrogenase)